MTSQEKGAKFEKIANEFFVWLFEEIGFIVAKDRLQFSGTQDGFDIHIIATFNNFERQIHIECKDYKNDLDVGNIFKKLLDLEKNYDLTENDLFIAISPRANFKNADNSEKTSPVLNDKFSFKSYLLDKSNYINELFALNDEFYKEIYNKDVNFSLDRAKELERFKAIIFSRKPFKKIFLTEKDKTDFIGVINSNANYLPRFLTTNLNNEDLYLFNRLNNNLQSLDDVLKVESKVLLLGNPGLGKSTELKEFALSKWKTGEQNIFTPIFRNLKNFTTSNKIEDFLPSNFEELTNCYVIFDGLDEIKDSQDFISKLEVFIEACDTNEHKSIKFLLSCRTNIYESIVKTINDFKVFYLNNLSNEDAFKLLKKQLNDSTLIEKLSFQRIHYDFLKNPFLIEILSDYINRNNNLPNNSIQLWENYINKRLEFDDKNKLLKLNLKTSLIINFSKKISLISELMKTNSIKETEIFELLSEQTQEYLKNPLIEKDLNNNSWNFEHRNIQEFFASKYLSELSYENIIDFISISENKKRKNAFNRLINWIFCSEKNSINKTHPSLFNTITFLINILDDNKSQQVIKWLEKNEPEILFTADSDRVNLEVRKIVFQNYFKKVCIENTFWISHNKSFSPETIAKFGDSEDNFNYLISIIENTNNHFRVIISAIELLAHMSLPTSQNDKIQTLLLLKLKSENIDSTNLIENDLKIKSYIITYIKKFNFHKENSEYLTNILEFFKNEDNRDFNNSLLHLINSLDDDIDKYFEFILVEFLRIFKINKRTVEEKRLYSKTVIQDLILRINDSDNFIKILNYIIRNDSNFSRNFDDNFIVHVFEKAEFIASFDNLFIDKILELLKERKQWFERENELVDFFQSTNSSTKLIDKVLSNEISLHESRYLVARLLSNENIHLIINKFIKEKTINNEVETFRNIIGNTNSRKLAKSFEKEMIGNGYIFDVVFSSEEEIEEISKEREVRKQYNFDILFDVKRIELEIKSIFDEINEEKITWDLICKYQSLWYNKNGHYSEVDSSLVLLQNLIRDRGTLSFNQIVSLIQEEYILMTEIRRYLNKKLEIKIDSSQQKIIYDWCLKSIEEINYDNIIIVKDNHSYSLTLDYFLSKNIYLFQKKFGFKLPQKFYRLTLKYSDFETFGNEGDQFNYTIERINAKPVSDALIIDNINKVGDLYFSSLRSHILYAIENNLIDSFEKIKEILFKDEYLCYQDNNLERIFEKTKDLDFLVKCCNDITSILCWEAIKILVKNNLETVFVIEKAKQYLSLNDPKYRLEALGILFKYNLPEAIGIFFNFVKEEIGESIKPEYYLGYNNDSGIEIIESFYCLLYGQNESDDVFKYHHAKELFRHYLNCMSSKNDDVFKKVQNTLKKIKKKEVKNKKELFHINMLIKNSIDSFVNFKSNPLEFNEAKIKVESF